MFSAGSRAGGRTGAAFSAGALACLIAVAGCGSGGGPPSWAGSLGSGVTVVPPGSPAPGNGSPDGVLTGVVSSIESGNYTGFCRYEQPTLQAQCNAGISQATSQQAASQLPTFKNVKVGYTAIDGDKALVGLTGTICVPNSKPACFTNNDPAALFSSGKSFATLWNEAVKAPSNMYALSPVTKINGNWYAYTGS